MEQRESRGEGGRELAGLTGTSGIREQFVRSALLGADEIPT